MTATLLIGIGNEFRGDDAAGLLVARRLADAGSPGLEIRESTGEALSLMDIWENAPRVILVDAVEAGEAPGTIVRFDASEKALPSVSFPCSTHAFDLAEAIELARSLGRLPSQVVVYGIQGEGFDTGADPGSSVLQSVEKVAERIRNEIL